MPVKNRTEFAFAVANSIGTVLAVIGGLLLAMWISDCSRRARELEFMTGRETSTWDIVCAKLHFKTLADLRRE